MFSCVVITRTSIGKEITLNKKALQCLILRRNLLVEKALHVIRSNLAQCLYWVIPFQQRTSLNSLHSAVPTPHINNQLPIA